MWNNLEIHSMRIQQDYVINFGTTMWSNVVQIHNNGKRNGCDGGIDLIDNYTKYRVRKSLLHADQELSRVINSL